MKAAFRAELARLGATDCRALVAVSGGVDSMALLELIAGTAAELGLEPIVAHLDHGIHPDSAAVAGAVATAAARTGLRFVTARVELGADASETAARLARHQWLQRSKERLEARWIVTAHHRDDQIETVLMRFLKGSGPAGLAGIAAIRGPWLRPLLRWTRAELLEFARGAGLEWWDDPSNRDPRHLRGWLRSQVLPLLEQRLPDLRAGLERGRAASADDRAAWDRLLEELPGLDFRQEPDACSVAVAPLAGYSSGVIRGLLRAMGLRLGIPLGGAALARVERLLAGGRAGRRSDLGSRAVAELSGGRVTLFRSAAHQTTYDRPVPTTPSLLEVDGWTLSIGLGPAPEAVPREGPSTWVPADVPMRVRAWRPGDRIRPLGGRGSRLVVRCMQDRKVPRSSRPSWPVVVAGSEVIWVPGVCRSGRCLPEPGAQALRIDARSS